MIIEKSTVRDAEADERLVEEVRVALSQRRISPEQNSAVEKRKQLMLAGGFALAAVLLLAAAPEFGAASALGSIGMGVASALTTFIARR